MKHQRVLRILVLLLLASAALWAVGICVGSTGFESTWMALQNSANPDARATAISIVRDIRLPRTLGAWLAGGLLGLSGALAQGLFRNPLADPYLMGSAAGASLGVAVALALMGGAGGLLGASNADLPLFGAWSAGWVVRLGLTGSAFLGASLAVMLTLALAKGVQHTLRLLLAGVIVGVVLGALSSLILLLSPDSLQSMQAFMLGSTAFVTWSACWLMLAIWLVSLMSAWAFSKALDSLGLGEATALSLGVPLDRMRMALVALLALATGTAVAQTGLIAFIGLAAPHLVRSLTRATHGQLVVLASLAGAVLLTAADILARALIAPQEMPVGVLTAVLGGGHLLWLMHRGGVKERLS